MSDHRLAGHSFTVTYDRKGRATITGTQGTTTAEIATAVTVEPYAEELPVEIFTSDDWPLMYVYTVAEARAYLADHPGVFQEHTTDIPHQRWGLPGEPDLAFRDLSDVMLYSLVVGKPVANPATPPPEPEPLPSWRTSEVEFRANMPRMVDGFTILDVGGYRPGDRTSAPTAIVITSESPCQGIRLSTHVLIWRQHDDGTMTWSVEDGNDLQQERDIDVAHQDAERRIQQRQQ